MGRPRKIPGERWDYILEELRGLTPLYQIARVLHVHRHTLERAVHDDWELEQALYESEENRFVQRALEFKGDPRRHILRTLYAWERLHPSERSPFGKSRRSWRDYTNRHPESLLPQRGNAFISH